MKRLLFSLLAAGLWLLPAQPAVAQTYQGPVTIYPPVTPGDCVEFATPPQNTNGLVDAGSPCGGGSGSTDVSGTANQITVTGSAGGPYTLSIPSAFVPPGTVDGLTIVTTSGTITITGSKSVEFDNSITFTGTDGTSFAFPAISATVAGLGVAQTWSALQSFNNADLGLNGSSSGTMKLEAPAAASTYVQTFPARTGTLVDGPSSSTSGDCVEFSGTSGSLLADAGAACGSGGGSGNALFGTTTGNVANDIVTMANTTVGVQDGGITYGLTGNSVLLETTSGGLVTASTLPLATSSVRGAVIPDGTIITVSGGDITVAKASSSGFGVAEVDNSTITASGGVISAVNVGTVTHGTITSGDVCLGGTSPQISCSTAPGTGVITALGQNVTGSGGIVLDTSPAISGASLSGTLSGTPTFSGNLTFSGVPVLSGLSSGTQVSCLGLNSGNDLVLSGSACGSGSGGSLTVEDLLGNSVSSTTQINAGLGDVVTNPSSGVAQIDHANITVTGDADFSSWGSPVAVQNVCFGTTLTASRTVSLPATTSFQTGQIIGVADCGGIGTSGYDIVVAPSGTDTINGVNASVTLANAWGSYQLQKTASGAWSVVVANNISSPASTTSGNLVAWNNTTGTAFGAGVPYGLTGASTVVETTSGGLITSSLIPTTSVNGTTCAPGSSCSPNGAVPGAHGSGATLSGPSELYVCTTTCTVTLPTPVEGSQFCVQNDDDVSTVITLAAISGVQFENTARSSYKSADTAIASGGAVGDQVCYVGRDSTHYNVWSYVGTWS